MKYETATCFTLEAIEASKPYIEYGWKESQGA